MQTLYKALRFAELMQFGLLGVHIVHHDVGGIVCGVFAILMINVFKAMARRD